MEDNTPISGENISSLKQEIKLLKQQLSENNNTNKQGMYENEYQSLYHNIPMGIMHYDSDGVILDCNDVFVEFIGSSHDKLVGLDMLNSLPNKRLVAAVKQSLIAGHAIYEGVYKSITANKESPVKILFSGIKGDKNKIVGGICIAEDLTKSNNNQLELKKYETNYKLIFENTTDVYYRTKLDGTILSMSPAVKDILLLDNYEDIIGQNVLDMYYNPTDRNLFITKIKEEGKVNEYRIALKRSNGSPITVEFNSKIIFNYEGEYDSIVGVFYDVTARMDAEREKATNIWFFERLEILDKIIRKSVNINEVYKEVVESTVESL